MNELPIIQVDAFTAEPFRGNPAAVCPPSDVPLSEEEMQEIAREMNLSETAFLQRRSDGDFDLRWFTPDQEVDLCGHATLASAHVLWAEEYAAPDASLTFHTRSGMLTARQDDGWIEMDFPVEPVAACPAPKALAEALGAAPSFVGKNRMDYLALLESEKAVRDLDPDLRRLKTVEARGIIATAPAENPEASGYDFVSRFFAPRVGVPEDPVTGSAHCALAPFWAERLDRPALVGYQASARGGLVRTEVQGERVALAGQAVTVLHGTLLI